jgi:DNA-binding MarR family transcriptional regulator
MIKRSMKCMPSDSDIPAQQASDVIQRLMRRIEADLHARRSQHGDLTSAQMCCLRELLASDHLTQSELAGRVHISPSTLVGVIDRLEQKGLVRRQRDAVDRRRINLRSTTMGQHTARQAPESFDRRLDRRIAALTPTEQEDIARALQAVVRLLDQEHEAVSSDSPREITA